MRPRSVTAFYQTAARAWLTAAVASLALPVSWRLGVWLPLHLALAGAISTAISGAMQNFMLAMTATPSPPERWVQAQFVLVTAGAGAIAIGVPTATPWLTARAADRTESSISRTYLAAASRSKAREFERT